MARSFRNEIFFNESDANHNTSCQSSASLEAKESKLSDVGGNRPKCKQFERFDVSSPDSKIDSLAKAGVNSKTRCVQSKYLDELRTSLAQDSTTKNSAASVKTERQDLVKSTRDSQRIKQYHSLKHQVHKQLERIYGNFKHNPYPAQLTIQPEPDNISMFRQGPVQTRSEVRSTSNPSKSRASVDCLQSDSLTTSLENRNLEQNPDHYEMYDSLGSACRTKRPLSEPFYSPETSRYEPPSEIFNTDLGHVESPRKCKLVSSEPIEIEQKRKQLESLQYATATAAALLRATANTAAAIASSNKLMKDQTVAMSSYSERCSPLVGSVAHPNPQNVHVQRIYSKVAQNSLYGQPRFPIYANPMSSLGNLNGTSFYGQPTYVVPPNLNYHVGRQPQPTNFMRQTRQSLSNSNYLGAKIIQRPPTQTYHPTSLYQQQRPQSIVFNHQPRLIQSRPQIYANPQLYATPNLGSIMEKTAQPLIRFTNQPTVPLIVGKNSSGQSLIKRICLIDLTLFWWSLLLLSLMLLFSLFYLTHYIL